MSKSKPEAPKRLAIIASKGTLDWGYPPFILASAAAAMGWECQIFFTFYGLTLLKKEMIAMVTPLGNPAMPMKMPFGSNEFQAFAWPIPTMAMGLPGFGQMATGLMKQTFKNKGVASLPEMREMCLELGVQLTACQMTMDVFGFDQSEFIDGTEVAGAAAFLEYASDADVTLFV
jgi:peroxiredoxin family protein